ncbi:L-gulonolactone oxidase-like [Schistocerca piceifrons]|uniref:L-gulonolactone oxidase-like n=1 Tax=Schistocerca piceifrons TaxID=274613 RepID=UPI001F5E927C|nr:L-gulonolactone oxidase-like [Schistocerca piceifrons]XP_047108651.1 L-gulonolactone oxidase-like [Schistocerca piceifrons]XP_047108652.1 L-gulonolactone oxidase-like [Schistocerca piceifrons]XP_047108653.1 L-gulonolactone oxidase-like [Schistocerca piceifrons]XP_047108654.1 L-gulonolactone oxidase-like [Schistocerca piceifrons]XP_047108656.1 L-gulonolactone oxidase-like [Schistocerca piceifrons]XP_047108657.1 L-gulonolactone oxidase-like [Schistocerca piceifrons]
MSSRRRRVAFYPKDLVDVFKILKQVKENCVTVKCCGGTYPVSENGDVLISLNNLRRILWYDPAEQILTVEAGVTLKEILKCVEYFNATLELYGTLPDMAVIDAVSIGLIGANGTIAQCIKACKVVSLHGDTIDCMWPCAEHVVDQSGKCDGNGTVCPTLQHVVCGLGCVGIVASVTLKCVPIHLAQQVTYVCTVKEIPGISERLSAALYSELLWYPLINRIAVTNHYPIRLHQGFYQPLWKKVIETAYILMHQIVTRVSPYMSWYFPDASAYLSRQQFGLVMKAASCRTGFCFKPQKFVSVESYCKGIKWSIPREHLPTLMQEIRSWAEKHKHFCSTPIVLCFQTNKDLDLRKPLLCPYTDVSTCTIWTDWFCNKNLMISYSAEMAEFESLLQKNFGRRCWSAGPVFISPLIGQMYPGFKHWCSAKSVLDPELIFRSPYVEGNLIIENC